MRASLGRDPARRLAASAGRRCCDRRGKASGLAQFLFDPRISMAESLIQGNGRFPAEHAIEQGVVAVASPYALRLREVVLFAEPLARDRGNLVDQFIDR